MSASVHLLLLTTAARARHCERTLATARQHHPGAGATVVVIDDRYGEISRGRTGWRPLQLADVTPSSSAESHPRRLAELALSFAPDARLAAVRPGVVRRVCDAARAEGVDAVIVLPDDAEILAPLTGFAQLSVDHGVALVPVRTDVTPRDGRLPDPVDHLRDGRIDRDLLAVSTAKGAAFLAWWSTQVADGPFEDPDRFDPVAQAWLDDAVLVHRTALLAHGALRSFRNIDETGDLDQATRAPALVVRFTGFDPARPWALSQLAGAWPRVLLSEHPELARLARERAAAITSDDGRPLVLSDPYARLATGHLVDTAMRRAYRRGVLDALRHGIPAPPNPFIVGESDAFERWLAEPVEGALSRHLVALRAARPDIARTFDGDPGALLAWAQRDAARVGVWTPTAPAAKVPAPIVDTASDVFLRNEVSAATGEPSGLNLIGLLSAQLGVGENARLVARSVRDARIPFSLVDHDDTVNERDPALLRSIGASAAGFRYDVDLVLVNADQTRRALDRYGRPGRRGRPTIGLWAWEVQEFPERMHDAFDLVDEVWVPSEFIRRALAPAGAEHGVEVHRLPVQLPSVQARPPRERTSPEIASLGLDPSRPMFLFSFDHFSVSDRKQPWAVVDAFRRAFPRPSANGPQLVVKSINSSFFPLEREHLLHAIGGRDDVTLVERYLPAATRDALVAHATAYVSLHRSEGLGLTLAEAMAVGTPCIATNWSGNLDFMTPDNSFLIDAPLVPIDPSTPVYAGMGSWAEPDLDLAASVMRAILDDPKEALCRAARAQSDLEARNTSGADVAFVLDRLRAVRRRHTEHRNRDGRMVS